MDALGHLRLNQIDSLSDNLAQTAYIQIAIRYARVYRRHRPRRGPPLVLGNEKAAYGAAAEKHQAEVDEAAPKPAESA